MAILCNRRGFVATTAAGVAAASFGATPARADPEPVETPTVRLPRFFPASCDVPIYVAEALLHAEGLTDVRYVDDRPGDSSQWIARGELDFDWNYAAIHVQSIEAKIPIILLGGLHSGCLELVANDSVRTVADLKGKRVGVWDFGSSPHVLVMLMAAYIGLDPKRDIEWVATGDATSLDLFVAGKIDAFLAAPPEPQLLRHRHLGHTVVATAVDEPWSQYYCCMLAGRADYVRNHPVATKGVLRALLKAVDLCVAEPRATARQTFDGGFTDSYDGTLEILSDVRYDRWREFDPADTVRFYALRLREAGLIRSDPNTILANGADWHLLDQVKRELKA